MRNRGVLMLKQIWINTGTKDITYFKNSIKAFQ